jgi:hypothetical protein
MPTLRVLIYACGTPEEILDQQGQCMTLADDLGPHEVVSLATDPPGETVGWASVCTMISSGEVDKVLVASRDLIPALDVLESVTREIRMPRNLPAPDDSEEPPWRRRPRRLRGMIRRRR